MTPNTSTATLHAPVNYRHVKSGGLYRLLSLGLLEATLEPMVVYQNIKTCEVWIRPQSEFFDGRFAKEMPDAQ